MDIHYKYAISMCFSFHTETAEEREHAVTNKKSSDVSISMIQMAYHPILVPVDIDDFEEDYEQFEENEDNEEYSDLFGVSVFKVFIILINLKIDFTFGLEHLVLIAFIIDIMLACMYHILSYFLK